MRRRCICSSTDVQLYRVRARFLRGARDAVQIFGGPVLAKIDDRFDYGETRIYAITVTNGLEITVIYIDISETERRIISAWRSERHGRKARWGSLG
jgi:uncharacterized DUF497 family protein